jgi:adenylate kinase
MVKMVFLGAPGVGKGTHSNLIASYYGIQKISTGDILRENVKQGTKLGMQAKKYMDAGGLVPDALVIKLLKDRISRADCKDGFILDGFPRTIPQAEALEKVAKMDLVVNLTAPKSVIVQRLSGRWTCRKCEAIYHETNLPPKKKGICDKCGGELYQREDQKPEVVRNRLGIYERDTAPLIDFYAKGGNLIDVNVEGEVGVVNVRVLSAIKKGLKR